MNREIKISEIKPFGGLASMLKLFDVEIAKCEKNGYSKRVSDLLSKVVHYGFVDTKGWFDEMKTEEDRPEIEMIVLLGHSYVIRLNNLAQKHINNIEPTPITNQLNTNAELKKFFKDVTFVE